MTATIQRAESAPEVSDRQRKPLIAVPLMAFALTAPLYIALALRNHAHLKTCGFDLGIFMQEVKAYAHLQQPIAPLLGAGASTSVTTSHR
ncbi:hypothetical protein [Antrihabitans cavernicola]|uniref:Uncharacterized protein n=1 Tax=Antrihabitans cavernicola TaxID=2495913 RepID=A0A5A7SEE4_9NOCA|nr:hypothetical protein [Spelaeibacter cavernicola]KAA0023779.1 hypothetical protein FOY51_04005 [Spelaeibacter cavernicola]